MYQSKGFTLIELLVVIAIVAVLATVVILTLNPAQLLAQARDSNRISDLGTLKSALSLYLADVSSPDIDGASNAQCFGPIQASTTFTNCNSATPSQRFAINSTAVSSSVAITSQRDTSGSGWLPVNFTQISSGAPLSALPLDPRNISTGGYFYAYRASSTTGTFEVNAKMESTKYANGGGSDVESTDGGNNTALFEVGNDPGLDL